MKNIILTIFIILSAIHSNAQKFPITADILRQTYLLKTDTLQGTSFLIEENNQEYLVTAKHLFRKKLKNGDSTSVEIYNENKPLKLNVKYLVHNDKRIDIAVLKINKSIQVITPFPIGGRVNLGQDIYFLGYPSFNKIQFTTSGTIGILPLVKKGIVSGWNKIGNYKLFFLDGHNNPGFSGGPVVAINYDTQKPVIFGVISGYYYEKKQVKNNKGINEPIHVQENSGIIKCYPTEMIKQIIK